MNLANGIEKGIDILIPSWKNFEYLWNCVDSIRRYSYFDHNIYVFMQEYGEKEISLLKEYDVYSLSDDKNIGVCRAVNMLFRYSDSDVIMYGNDDMIFLPLWDYYLYRFARDNDLDDNTWLSSTMVEPGGNNSCVLVHDYGNSIESFDREGLINNLENLRNKKHHVRGTTWPPNLMMRKYFERVGGMSEDYGVGIGSDPDLVKKLYNIGFRDFIGVGDSLVYHFGSKTTRRVKRNDGKHIFHDKHGMSIDYFVNDILRRGERYEP